MENRLTMRNGMLTDADRSSRGIAYGGRAVASGHAREHGLGELAKVINASDKLSADGTLAVANMIYPPSKWPNPGYPDGNTSCSTRANADLLSSIAPPGAANGTEKLWNCHIITNPGWYKTPVLVVAYINGYEDYVNKSPTSIGPQTDFDKGYNYVSCVGGDVYVDADMIGTLGNGSTCVAYRKWIRDTKLAKFNELLSWRCLAGSTTSWMDCAELYKQGTVHGAHAPAPTEGHLSIQDPAIGQIFDDGVYGTFIYNGPILGNQCDSASLTSNNVAALEAGTVTMKTKAGCVGWNTTTKQLAAIPAGTEVALDLEDTKQVNLSIMPGVTTTSDAPWPFRPDTFYPFVSRGLDHVSLVTEYFDVPNASWTISSGRNLDVTSIIAKRFVFPDQIAHSDGTYTNNTLTLSPIAGDHNNVKVSGWGAVYLPNQENYTDPPINSMCETIVDSPQINAAITNGVFTNASTIPPVVQNSRYSFSELREMMSKNYFLDDQLLSSSTVAVLATDTSANSYYVAGGLVTGSSVNEFSNFGAGWTAPSHNYIIPLDKDTMQAYGYMMSQPAAQGAFQICRLAKESNGYVSAGGQTLGAAAFFIEADGNYPSGNYADPMMYGVGTESLTFVVGNGAAYETPPQYNTMALRQRNDGLTTTNGAYKVASGDPTAVPVNTRCELFVDEDTLPEVVSSINGLYNHVPSSDAWGTSVCLYEGLAGRAVIRLKCCRDLEIIPSTGSMALQKTSIPCLPDSIAREVGIRMLSCIPPLMLASDNDMGSFLSIAEKVGQLAAPITAVVAPEFAPYVAGMEALFRNTQAMHDKTKALTLAPANATKSNSSMLPFGTGVGRRTARRQERRARGYKGPVGTGAVGGGGWTPSSVEGNAVAAQSRAGTY